MKKVAVVFGGTSTEHIISLKTGRFIYETLLKRGHSVLPILYTKSGLWAHPDSYNSHLFTESYSDPLDFENKFCNHYGTTPGFFPVDKNFDVCFLGLHGGTGENGTIQGFFEIIKLPYTGSGVHASSLAMDKYLSYQIFEKNGFHVSPYFEVHKKDFYENKDITKEFKEYPYFIKPTCGGSSVSTGLVKNSEAAIPFLESLFIYDDRALFQIPTEGIEVSCGVIERKIGNEFIPRALYPTEILPTGEFFDFHSKYSAGGSREITPARISEESTELIRNLAIKAHKVLGCKGYSRTDFIISENIPYILETNTLPGMTETSLIPQQIRHQKETMEDILDLLMENALLH